MTFKRILADMSQGSLIRIGGASAFWGDTSTAARQLVEKGEIDYLVFDYLSEVTMALLAKARAKDPTAGAIPDFSEVIQPLLPLIAEKKIRVISNAGAMNALSLQQKLQQAIAELGLSLKVASVEGDELEATQPNLSRHAYLGAAPLVQALQMGADIVISGRHVDSANVLAPLIHEFSWDLNDYDRLAQGSLAGHLLECGAQVSGGNFTDWQVVPEPENIGFPIAVCQSDGSFSVTKPESTGGLVNVATVAEQLVYEIGDPRSYRLPDVFCDFSEVRLQETGPHEVLVRGARGKAPGPMYKVCTTYVEDFRLNATFFVAGGEALTKAQSIVSSIEKKVATLLKERGLPIYENWQPQFLGAKNGAAIEEILVRLVATHRDPVALKLLAAEIAPAATALAPGIVSLLGGRAKPIPRVKLKSEFIAKKDVPVQVSLGDEKAEVDVLSSPAESKEESTGASNVLGGEAVSGDIAVPLHRLAYARSGDKGSNANIGVIARKPEYLPLIQAGLSHQRLAEFFSTEVEGESQVESWLLPGIHAVNILLKDSLAGGGLESLDIDPQGKAFAQRLLQIEIPVNSRTAEELL